MTRVTAAVLTSAQMPGAEKLLSLGLRCPEIHFFWDRFASDWRGRGRPSLIEPLR